MNVKTRIGKRYKPPVARPNWEVLETYQLGEKTLQRGDEIRLRTAKGKHAQVFAFQYAERNVETGAVSLAFVGGKAGHKLDRFFRPEQIVVA